MALLVANFGYLKAITEHERLVQAVKNNDILTVKKLIEANVNVSESMLLKVAIRRNNVEIVKLLLQAGASPNQELDKGNSYGHLVLSFSKMAIAMQKSSCQLPDYISFKSQQAQRDRIAILELLLSYGLDLKNDSYLLSYACQMADYDAVILLIKYGIKLKSEALKEAMRMLIFIKEYYSENSQNVNDPNSQDLDEDEDEIEQSFSKFGEQLKILNKNVL